MTLPALCAPAETFDGPQVPSNEEILQSYEQFRKKTLDDYNSYQKDVLDRYAEFLDGVWERFDSLQGESRLKKPKPKTLPRVNDEGIIVGQPVVKPADLPSPAPEMTVAAKHPETPELTKTPQQPETKQPEAPQQPGSENVDTFDFYGMPVELTSVDFNIKSHIDNNEDLARQWQDLSRSGIAETILPALQDMARGAGLNDYLFFRLAEAYVNARFPDADDTSRTSLIHFLLTNAGYDTRIALSESGVPLLLLPFRQMVYARMATQLNGTKYYVFTPDGVDESSIAGQSIYTCRLPEAASSGKTFDLVLKPLNLPVRPKPFDIQYGDIHLKGEVNENLMSILYRYPQMPIGDYARSVADTQLRESLVEQLRSQLQGVDSDEGVEKLLGFMHNAFKYSTDQDYHGFEKPYFVEETLYYPLNDCEDRAIFYTYFLWNALGKEAQLISFPDHEAATVRLSNPIRGTSYSYDGGIFYISDPTFVGARTGMVMPAYTETSPLVDYTFSDR